MIADNHHRIQVMLLADAPLSESERDLVKQHLSTCANCRSHAELIKRLEAGHWSPYRKSPLSAAEKLRIAHTFQSHRRRQPMRNTNYFSLLGWASFILILVIALGWALNILRPASPLSGVKTSPVPSTQPSVKSFTPLPQEAAEPPLLNPTQMLDVGNATDFAFERGYQNRTDSVLVDLNCDGQNEQLLTAYRIPTNTQDDGSVVRDYLGVILQVPDDHGSYQSAWAYTFEHSSRDSLYHVQLFPISGCEQLIIVDGQRWMGNVGAHSLQFLRWDGNEMKIIFEVAEGLLDKSGSEATGNEGISITTFTYGSPDPNRHTCDWTYHRYDWDGETFTLVDEWQEQNQPCGGAGG